MRRLSRRMAWPSTRRCVSANERSGLSQTIGVGSRTLLSSKGLRIVKAVKEVSSGRNGQRERARWAGLWSEGRRYPGPSTATS
ncbi:hypothetical protein MPNT_170025 [Candidatus Methylacidithermus pantelleriae]|uniref:Uncharacterized protein n=1 Tax=Candidatus Methylacidithermus pantelleriae TaxID=2744239 RepID=A0A8J2FNB2_9BACT|nr:hypothetical protein MPNT_170025 [Candidatus Methylacidithermus pantelleriae]